MARTGVVIGRHITRSRLRSRHSNDILIVLYTSSEYQICTTESDFPMGNREATGHCLLHFGASSSLSCVLLVHAVMGKGVLPSDTSSPSDPKCPKVSSCERCFEFLAAMTTGLIYTTKWLNPPVVFLGTFAVLWILWFLYQCRRHGKRILFLWGFRSDNLKRSFLIPTCFAVVAILIISIVAVVGEHNMAIQNWHFWFVLIVFPFWGLLQQAVVFFFLFSIFKMF